MSYVNFEVADLRRSAMRLLCTQNKLYLNYADAVTHPTQYPLPIEDGRGQCDCCSSQKEIIFISMEL
jgi:hypothetical protein